MNQWYAPRKSVLEAARRMLEKGLVIGTSGNVSRRLPPENGRQLMAITPTSREYDSLEVEDIPIVDFTAGKIDGEFEPSIETPLHITIYQARPDVNAIIHTHSVFASAVAVTGRDIPPILEDQVAVLGGGIHLAGYAASGSPEQLTNVLKALGDRNAVLLAHHGAVCTGRSLREAFIAAELVEKTARVYLLALSAGTVNRLPG